LLLSVCELEEDEEFAGLLGENEAF
jgi:hypothetical protein